MIQGDQPCSFVLTAFDTGTSFAVDGFAAPALVAGDLLDEAGLASRIAAAADPVSAFLRGAIGGAALLDGLNAVIAEGSVYDEHRFAGVTLSPETQAARTAGGDRARLNRLLLQDAYPDLVAGPTSKRVLRFGNGIETQSLAVQLPAGATVTKASLCDAGEPAAGPHSRTATGASGPIRSSHRRRLHDRGRRRRQRGSLGHRRRTPSRRTRGRNRGLGRAPGGLSRCAVGQAACRRHGEARGSGRRRARDGLLRRSRASGWDNLARSPRRTR